MKNLNKFFKSLAKELQDNEGNFDTDHPDCPCCGSTMNFYGHDDNGDFAYGDGYWKCPSCGYKFSENDLNDY